MKLQDSSLTKASMFLVLGRPGEVITLLSPQIFMYRNNPRYFYLLGLACLRTGDIGGAHSYLKRGEDLGKPSVDLLLALAVMHLQRNEEDEAVVKFLQVQEQEPENKLATMGLELVKVAPERTDWSQLGRQGALNQLIPQIPWYSLLAWWHPLLAVAGLTVIVFLVSWMVGVSRWLASPRVTEGASTRIIPTELSSIGSQRSPNPIPNLANNEIDEPQTSVPLPNNPPYTGNPSTALEPGLAPYILLTDQEIRAAVQALQNHYRDYLDNQARIEINRILLSNASQQTKNAVTTLLANLRRPDFTRYRDPVSWEDVRESPVVHEGVWVRLRGRVAAYSRSNNRASFELLVGYESSPVVQDTVLASTTVPQALRDGDAIELIGQVVLDSPRSSAISLDVTDIRLILP